MKQQRGGRWAQAAGTAAGEAAAQQLDLHEEAAAILSTWRESLARTAQLRVSVTSLSQGSSCGEHDPEATLPPPQQRQEADDYAGATGALREPAPSVSPEQPVATTRTSRWLRYDEQQQQQAAAEEPVAKPAVPRGTLRLVLPAPAARTQQQPAVQAPQLPQQLRTPNSYAAPSMGGLPLVSYSPSPTSTRNRALPADAAAGMAAVTSAPAPHGTQAEPQAVPSAPAAAGRPVAASLPLSEASPQHPDSNTPNSQRPFGPAAQPHRLLGDGGGGAAGGLPSARSPDVPPTNPLSLLLASPSPVSGQAPQGPWAAAGIVHMLEPMEGQQHLVSYLASPSMGQPLSSPSAFGAGTPAGGQQQPQTPGTAEDASSLSPSTASAGLGRAAGVLLPGWAALQQEEQQQEHPALVPYEVSWASEPGPGLSPEASSVANFFYGSSGGGAAATSGRRGTPPEAHSGGGSVSGSYAPTPASSQSRHWLPQDQHQQPRSPTPASSSGVFSFNGAVSAGDVSGYMASPDGMRFGAQAAALAAGDVQAGASVARAVGAGAERPGSPGGISSCSTGSFAGSRLLGSPSLRALQTSLGLWPEDADDGADGDGDGADADGGDDADGDGDSVAVGGFSVQVSAGLWGLPPACVWPWP